MVAAKMIVFNGVVASFINVLFQTTKHNLTKELKMKAVQFLANSCMIVSFVLAIPVYWINLDAQIERRNSMINHLTAMGFQHQTRISALTPETANVILLERSCRRNSFEEISILCSHLLAIYTAIHDSNPMAKQTNYALIVEDDIQFQFEIDFDRLVESAPRNFGSLQLMTSHLKQAQILWKHFEEKGELWTPRPPNSTIWSAQAYIINKNVLKPFIDFSVAKDRQGRQGFKLASHSNYDRPKEHMLNRYKPLVPTTCLFADMFIYSVAQPAFILNVPLVNSAGHGVNSTIHDSHVMHHALGFAHHQRVQKSLREGKTAYPLPVFAKVISQEADLESVDWELLSKLHPVTQWAESYK